MFAAVRVRPAPRHVVDAAHAALLADDPTLATRRDIFLVEPLALNVAAEILVGVTVRGELPALDFDVV